MQKWLPDAFTVEKPTGTAAQVQTPNNFEAEGLSDHQEQNDRNRMFMSESGFAGPETIMGHLTPEERNQVFDLVEQDIQRVFEAQENELIKNNQIELERVKTEFESTFNNWSAQLQDAMANHMKETADASARMALILAEKVIRKKIDSDPEILIRALETTLFKMDGKKTLTVSIHPEQVDLLNKQTELMERLGIDQVVSDRRVDPGGCIVQTEKQEWDATIKGQIESLGEIIEEMISTGETPDLSVEGKSDDNPILD
ncbi:MAG: hypothetical protein GY780_17690 [bacterium]|nr:hypothetical protein [bacterium]